MNTINSNDTQEVWREIRGFTFYEVSNFGRVRSLPRTVIRAGHPLTIPGGLLTPIINKGYPRVTMRSEGKTYYRFPHQMVADAFLGPCPPNEEVRHKDGDRSNPRLDNLEYGTRAQNIADCKVHGNFRNGVSHLTEEMVRAIAARHEDSAAVLAAEFGVSAATVGGIRSRRVWTHLNLEMRTDYRRRGAEHPARRGKQVIPDNKV